jgi:hypothetical protein
MIRRLRCNAQKAERWHCAVWFRTIGGMQSAEGALGEGSQGSLLCSSGYHRFANFQSFRFIIAALSDLQLIAAKAPVRTCPPGSGQDRFLLRSVSPEALAEDEADQVFLMVDMGLCPCRDRESRSRSSTILEAPRRRLIKRSHQSEVRGAEPAR